MNNLSTALLSSLIALVSFAGVAQDTSNLPYMDSKLSPEQRAADLVHRMTLQEKASQLVNQSRAIPRLNVPAYDWWSEALHGVAVDGTTEFPEPVGLAATFDTPRIHEMATAISTEARIVHIQAVRKGTFPIFHGLDFWSPNVNIFRDPRWGRGQETYGEDPFLSGRMGVAFVTGMQGDDPKYVKAGATAKHYAVHSGPEPSRHYFDVHPSEEDLYETYLPAFRALVQEGHVSSVMGAYNRVNGVSASASPRLLHDILRQEWGFKGYIVSDCDSVDDIYKQHESAKSPEEGAAMALRAGLDLDCGHAYAALAGAVKQGLVTEAQVDIAVRRLMLARMQL